MASGKRIYYPTMGFDKIIEIVGVVVGLVYLYLEYKASIHLWVVSIIMPAIYLYIFFNAGLYADVAINIYYLLIALYGWAAWKYRFSLSGRKVQDGQTRQELKISHAEGKDWAKATVGYLVAQFAIAWALDRFTDSNVVWADSFISALSIVGMWMLARKKIEQWWIWLVVDVASVALFCYKELYFTAGLYLLYAVIAVFGYRKWKRLMQQNF